MTGRLRRGCLRAFALALVLASPAPRVAPAAAQTGEPVDVGAEIFVNTEAERYLRVLQLVGAVPLHPWSLRAFVPREVDSLAPLDSVHPWHRAYRYSGAGRGNGVRLVRPRARIIANSTLPQTERDGAVWAGRGFTAAVSGGAALRAGPLWITLAPVAFVAQNAEFELLPNGREDGGRFASARSPTKVDAPQRFGDGAYARLDPGQSSARIALGPVALGASTANQHWGPAAEYPLVLGSNAPGFPHVFAGTNGPVPIGVGRVSGRFAWGSLAESGYALTHPDSTRRFSSSLAVVFSPRGLSGLEIGGARFFHTPWPSEGLRAANFLMPLEGLLKKGLGERIGGPDAQSDADNQLASVFARWVAPRSGFEVYGEFAREDHNYDLRDLLLQPDHSAAYMLGVARAWRGEDDRLVVLRAEVANAEISHIHMSRGQVPFYVHSMTRQGHTHRGRFLGSPAVFGGSGAIVRADRYTPRGRVSVFGTRELLASAAVPETPLAEALRVRLALGGEMVSFRGPLEVSAGVVGSAEANREPGRTAYNLQVRLGAAHSLR